jgi:hypothetical protein
LINHFRVINLSGIFIIVVLINHPKSVLLFVCILRVLAIIWQPLPLRISHLLVVDSLPLPGVPNDQLIRGHIVLTAVNIVTSVDIILVRV